jgi:hypothetical protein
MYATVQPPRVIRRRQRNIEPEEITFRENSIRDFAVPQIQKKPSN